MTGPRTLRVLREGHPAGSLELGHDRLVIRLPDPLLLRLVARSVLVAAAILSFPCLRTMLPDSGGADTEYTPSAVYDGVGTIREDDAVHMLMLFGDMKRQGLLKPEDRAVFLGDPSFVMLPFLKRSRVDPVTEQLMSKVADHSVDFVFMANGDADTDFSFTDRVLKVGGIAAMRLGLKQFHMLPNYRIAYIRRFGSTVVAMKKIAHVDGNVDELVGTWMRRRLLAVLKAKEKLLKRLKGVLLEPPASMVRGKYQNEMWYSPRRVFVDLGSGGSAGSFNNKHTRGNQEFDIIRLNAMEKGIVANGGIAEWLQRNVVKEDYVLMKAEAGIVKELVKSRAIGLVDELYLEYSHQFEEGKKGVKRNRRAYREFLALYGKLKDEGVAVRQWWSRTRSFSFGT